MNLVQREIIEIEQILGTSSNLLKDNKDATGSTFYSDLPGKLSGIRTELRGYTDSHNASSVAVHGLGSSDGNVVGTTASQTLVNKTLSSPTINGGTINATSLSVNSVSVVDVSTAQNLSNKTLTNPIITGSTGTIVAKTLNVGTAQIDGTLTVGGKQILTSLDNASATGMTLTTSTVNGGTVNATTLQKNGVDAATLTGAETLTNKTLSSPTISGTVQGNFTFGGTVTFSGTPTVSGLIPPGTVIMYAGNGAAPTGWLECDGFTYAYSSYSALGTALGVSSGNFTVPNLNNAFPRGTTSTTPYSSGFASGGSSTITLTKANLPQHTHTIAHDHTVKMSRDYNVNTWTTGDTVNSGQAGHSHTGFYRSDFAGGGAGNWDVMRPQTTGGYASQGSNSDHPDMVYGTSAHSHAVDIIGQSAGSSGNGSADSLAGSAISNVVPPYVSLRFLIKT
jgi:microcystin-dependent protein